MSPRIEPIEKADPTRNWSREKAKMTPGNEKERERECVVGERSNFITLLSFSFISIYPIMPISIYLSITLSLEPDLCLFKRFGQNANILRTSWAARM